MSLRRLDFNFFSFAARPALVARFRAAVFRAVIFRAVIFWAIAATLAIGLVAGAAGPAAAQYGTAGEDERITASRYQRCLALAEVDPNSAFDQAVAWRQLGGGVPARHCEVMALVTLGHYEEAAARLEELGQTAEAGDGPMRAQFLAQAGNAWLLAGDGPRAVAALDQAVSLDGADANLLVDRARARAELQDWAAAEADLSAALALAPGDPQVLLLRANARRARGNTEAARADAEAVLALDPSSAAALLERGVIALAEGKTDAARADLEAAVDAAPAGSPVASDAQAYLDQLNLQ